MTTAAPPASPPPPTARPRAPVSPARRLRALLPDAAAIGLLLALTLLFYWRLFAPDVADRASFPRGDFQEKFYPFALFRARELGEGRWPLWYPHAYGGGPFLADIEAAVFYPPSWAATLLGLPYGYPLAALEAEAVTHIFLAGALTYLLARRLYAAPASPTGSEAVTPSGGRILAPLAAAIVFAFGGYLTSYPPQQLAILEVQTWLPLILLCLHGTTAARRAFPGRLAWSIGAGLALGLSVLAGHAQSAMYVLYGTLVYALFRLGCRARDAGPRRALVEAAVVLLAFPLGLAVAAAQLVPTLEFLSLSTRQVVAYDFTWRGFPVRDVLQLLLPGSVSLYSPLYVGLVPLALAGLALARRPRREALFWAGLAAGGLLLSLGGHTILYSLLSLILPGFALFRGQERAVVFFSFAMALLAGAGLRAWLEAGPAADRAAALARRGALAAALLVAALAGAAAPAALEPLAGQGVFLLLIALLAAGLAELRRRDRGSRGLGALALALIVFDLFTVNARTSLAPIPPPGHYPATPVTAALQAEAGGYRVHNHFQLPLDYGAVYGVEDVMGQSQLEVRRYHELRATLPRERLWALMHVRYLISWEGTVPGAMRLAAAPLPTDPKKEMTLHRLPEPPPAVAVVHEAIVADGDEALALLAAGRLEPGSQVVLAAPPPVALPGGPPTPATLIERRPGRIVVEAAPDRPGILRLSEVDYPGWEARIDGRPAAVVRVDYALRGVPLPPGRHRVELVFDPPSVKLGIAISALALTAAAAGLLAAFLLRARARPAP